MRKYFLIITFLFVYTNLLTSQSEIRVYVGSNFSIAKYTKNDYVTMLDTIYLKNNYIILPCLGVDIDFNISSKFSLTTGLGVNILGSKNYNLDADIPGLNIDSDLKIGYLRIPATVNYKIMDNIKLIAGYSFNYSFRKNINFYAVNFSPVEVEGIYHPLYHTLVFGVLGAWKDFDLEVSYNRGISKIWDTGDFYEEARAFINLNSFRLTVGYIIRE